MKQAVPQTSYEFDAEGHLVRLEGETDEDYTNRTAQVLHREGLSANHPDDVAASNAPAEPPPEGGVMRDAGGHKAGSGFGSQGTEPIDPTKR